MWTYLSWTHTISPRVLHIYPVGKAILTIWQNMKVILRPTSFFEKQFHQTVLFQLRPLICKRSCKSHIVLGPPEIFNEWKFSLLSPSARDNTDSPLRLEKIWDKFSEAAMVSAIGKKLEVQPRLIFKKYQFRIGKNWDVQPVLGKLNFKVVWLTIKTVYQLWRHQFIRNKRSLVNSMRNN